MVQKIICRRLSIGKLAKLYYQSVENILWLFAKAVEHFLWNILMSKIFLGLWENALSNIFCRKLYVFPAYIPTMQPIRVWKQLRPDENLSNGIITRPCAMHYFIQMISYICKCIKQKKSPASVWLQIFPFVIQMDAPFWANIVVL